MGFAKKKPDEIIENCEIFDSPVCHVSGLPIISKPNWQQISAEHSYRFQYAKIGENIIYSKTWGNAGIDLAEKAIGITEEILAEADDKNSEIIMIEDYSKIIKTSSEAKNRLIDFVKANKRITNIILVGLPPTLLLLAKIAKATHLVDRNTFFTSTYSEAIKHLQTKKPQLLKPATLALVDQKPIPRNKTMRLDLPDFSVEYEMIGKNLLKGVFEGNFTTANVDKFFEFTEKCYKVFGLSSEGFYIIADWSGIKGATWHARKQYVKKANIVRKRYASKLIILIGLNPILSILVNISKPFMKAKFLSVNTHEEALDTIVKYKESNSLTTEAQQSYTLDEVIAFRDDMISHLTEVNWQESGIKESDNPIACSSHPLQELYSALKLFKMDFDRILRVNNETKSSLLEREQDLIKSARLAGRAEIATNVLHNIGNVLNSVGISLNQMKRITKKPAPEKLKNILDAFEDENSEIGRLLRNDDKGKMLIDYLKAVSISSEDENTTLTKELKAVSEHFDHIKQIIALQQTANVNIGVLDIIDVNTIIENALQIQALSNANQIQVVKTFDQIEPLEIDQHRTLQILINLLSNAIYAVKEAKPRNQTIKIDSQYFGGSIKITVEDNGVGIVPENLKKLFSHGFTTKKDGHGFGLHGAANAATEMKGSLKATSAGEGSGAKFTLIFPASSPNKKSSPPPEMP